MKIEFDYKQGEWIQLKAYLFPYLHKSELVKDFVKKVNTKTRLRTIRGQQKLQKQKASLLYIKQQIVLSLHKGKRKVYVNHN